MRLLSPISCLLCSPFAEFRQTLEPCLRSKSSVSGRQLHEIQKIHQGGSPTESFQMWVASQAHVEPLTVLLNLKTMQNPSKADTSLRTDLARQSKRAWRTCLVSDHVAHSSSAHPSPASEDSIVSYKFGES